MKALKAVEDPRKMKPMMKTMEPFNRSAHTGTFRDEWTLPKNVDPNKALSRPSDHVRRDAVCWTAARATMAAINSNIMKIVAAVRDRVAWIQIS